MSFDFSGKPDLIWLAHIARDLRAVAQPIGIDFFLMGAAARDLMLQVAYGIDTGRKTEDVDFSVMVSDWTTFLHCALDSLKAEAF